MLRSMSAIRVFFAAMSVLWAFDVVAAELPSADAILQIHRENKERLSRLHLQLVHRYETTKASCRAAQKTADEKENFRNLLLQTKPEDLVIEFNGQSVRGKEAQQLAALIAPANEIKALRSQVKPFQTIRPMEFFLNGDDYQFRQPVASFRTEEELKGWSFPDAPLTAKTLLTAYRDVSIFSRLAASNPAARWWHQSADSHAYIMQKHLTEVLGLNLPPFTDVTRSDWGRWHPYDAFFSQPAEKYRVVREEEIGGRLLTVVDVLVPIAPGSPSLLFHRGWLDLKRGALPMKMFDSQCTADAPRDFFERTDPGRITTTHEVRELPGGAFYPVKSVSEDWLDDPDAPPLSKAELAEVQVGKRKTRRAVHRRHTWDCSLVTIRTRFDDNFFVIPFPEGQQLFDHDAGRMIGALSEKPLVEVGQQAPPLTIARWLDDKPRTLDDLKGRVVVLDFWGLWCGACRSSVPKLKALQERLHDQPVTFISIHNAEKDPKALAARIEEFKKSKDWHYIGAIDTGRMIEDSVTMTAYGVKSFPLMVIVGPDGKIAYVDSQIDGPQCDEEDPVVLAEFEKKANDFMKARFKSVGETWPIAANLNQEEQQAIHRRVEMLFITQQIESALKSKR